MEDKTTYKPSELAAAILAIPGGSSAADVEALREALEAHVDDTDVHVSTAEKAAWDGKAAKPQVVTASFSADWSGDGPWTQTVTIGGAGASSKVDIQPDAAMLAQLVEDGVTALWVENDGGVFTAYAMGAAPTAALTVQATVTEIELPPVALKFSSPSSFTLSIDNAKKNWDGTLESSIDGKAWNEWDGTTTLSSGENNTLYLRGTGNSVISGRISRGFVVHGNDIRCDGNIEALLDYTTVEHGGHPTMQDNCFAFLFANNTALAIAPSLPATTLTKACYRRMFSECTQLTTLPALPAAALTNECYQYMFNGCTSIKLSTTRDDTYKYEYRIPTSGDGTTATDALEYMFTYTGGTFTGTPTINTTYYTDHEPVV